MLVELDRKGSRDAVYYGCDNEVFEEYITGKGFQTAFGSFSDISVIAPAMGIAAVNLSIGYYHAHTTDEYINRSQTDAVIEKAGGMVVEAAKQEVPQYEYIECDINFYGWGCHPMRGGCRAMLPKDLPRKYEEVYDILLDHFSMEELEMYRKEYGNAVLLDLYASLF